jgi:hypothetical protein
MSRFGNMQNSPSNSDDPLTFCLADTMDSKFLHGSTAVEYGPRSRSCQNFMAERCANKWDGFCEYFYVEHSKAKEWPNNRIWPNMGSPNQWINKGASVNTIGEQLLKDAAERKYCTYPTCTPVKRPFDPMNPQSPMVTSWQNSQGGTDGCVPVCRVNPATVDGDVIMDRMLANPMVAGSTIINICNTAAREGTDLRGTKIGALCANYSQANQAMNGKGLQTYATGLGTTATLGNIKWGYPCK